MAKGSGGTRKIAPEGKKENLPNLSKIARSAKTAIGEAPFSNVISGVLEITNRDIHNLVYEIKKDESLRSVLDKIVPNVREFIETGKYVGWAESDKTHPEVAYFAYYNKTIGQNIYLGIRYMKTTKKYKPYVFYSEDGFKERQKTIKKGLPIL